MKFLTFFFYDLQQSSHYYIDDITDVDQDQTALSKNHFCIMVFLLSSFKDGRNKQGYGEVCLAEQLYYLIIYTHQQKKRKICYS